MGGAVEVAGQSLRLGGMTLMIASDLLMEGNPPEASGVRHEIGSWTLTVRQIHLER